MMERGRERFNIYCATCHGRDGEGNGVVTSRAAEVSPDTWGRPTSLNTEYVRGQPVGRLFNTITNGINRMPGYGAQIPVADRWAIVLYVRALQRSRAAALDDLPPEKRTELGEPSSSLQP
jgi:mono/diheme cytochrome c family protein